MNKNTQHLDPSQGQGPIQIPHRTRHTTRMSFVTPNDVEMPTNRPFLSNFLAAFRAHSAVSHGKATSASASTHPNPSNPSTSTQTSTSQTVASNPRTISTTTKSGVTSAALASIHSPRNVGSPLSRSPGDAAYDGSPGRAAAMGVAGGKYMARARRGSDSSSEGFRDVLGAEKWYIGGRTAAGEEKYFKLGVVKRQRSGGSLSLDRLSL